MNGKKQMSIGTKITLGFVGLAFVSVIVGAIGLYSLSIIGDFDDQIYNRDLIGMSHVKEADSDLLQTITAEKNFLICATEDERNIYRKQMDDNRKAYLDEIGKARALLTSDDGKRLMASLDEAYATWTSVQKRVVDLGNKDSLQKLQPSEELSMGEAQSRYNAVASIFNDIESLQEKEAKALLEEGNRTQDTTAIVVISVILAGFILGIFAGFLISRSISRPVTTFVKDLSEASSQIGISSGQLSQASQEIANGATEQASQVEETSASMEELASMVKQNVENAKQASLLAGRSTESSRSGSQEMSLMVGAMEGISRSAEEIRNVIDVIEDIAFQTNMLALNAAVEAARAGEAGLGFAVVADEVKNLANRSAASAKETATMIKETTAKIGEGMEISRRLSVVFQEILNDSQKVGEVTREVEIASQQQEEGIDQVNQAIVQFDSVVQNNASSSEETASAAEELQSQVQTLEGVIQQLYRLVTGREHAKAAVAEHRLPPPRPAARDGSERRNGHQQKISFETDEELVRS